LRRDAQKLRSGYARSDRYSLPGIMVVEDYKDGEIVFFQSVTDSREIRNQTVTDEIDVNRVPIPCGRR